jgi:hypothetical protein
MYWRWARRLLVGIAVVVTSVAVFYSFENWRGKRAWDNCRRQLEARGEVLDWAAYVPPPVPDDQNLFKAPGISDWFVQEFVPDPGGLGMFAVTADKQWPYSYPKVPGTNRLLLAEVRISTTSAPHEAKGGEIVVQWDGAAARKRIAEILDQVAGPRALGSAVELFLQRSFEEIRPVSLLVQAQNNLGYEDLGALLSFGQWPEPHMGGGSGCTTAEPSPKGGPIRLWMNGPCHAAAEFLAATESYTNAFEIIRRAFERPYGRIDGDYRMPLLVPHPHWVAIRNLAQILCSRAQCHLLLGKPETAWDELKLAWESHRFSEANPPDRPMTVVGAMINGAMRGLYACTIQDGLRLHAWREPQLLAIERELKQADVLADVTHALRTERASDPEAYQISRLRGLGGLLPSTSE